jgi:hypothetical protein
VILGERDLPHIKEIAGLLMAAVETFLAGR